MRILITNDDGIAAEGLALLEKIAKQFSDDIWVVAPAENKSGSARSLSLEKPMALKEVGEKKWSLAGTPADCVIMGVNYLMPKGVDLILSGINEGQNMADYIHYSGTVAAAMEGCLLGIKSLALSQARDFSNESDATKWQVSEIYGGKILQRLLNVNFPKQTFLNINFPNCKVGEVRGSKITQQAHIGHALGIEKQENEYWLSFASAPIECENNSDIFAINNKYISITPLTLDINAKSFFTALQNEWQDE